MLAALRLWGFLCMTVLFGGCAVGQKYSYHNTVAEIAATGTQSISVATSDQRPYVLSGKKSPDVVGLLRGGYGNPFNVTTESGRPLADDITQTVVSSLTKKGFKAVPITVSHIDSMDNILEKLKNAQGENLILVTLYEWKSNAYANVGLYYDVNLKVFDKSGKVLAENSIKGEDNLGGSLNIVGHSKTVLPQTFKKKLEELFNNPVVVKALQQ